MTQAFTPDGDMVPLTVVEAGPCPVVQKKTTERDGYHALQLGFLSQKPRRTTKPRLGHFAKATVEPTRYLREFRTDEASDLEVGQMVNVEIFAQGQPDWGLTEPAQDQNGRFESGQTQRRDQTGFGAAGIDYQVDPP